MEDIQIKNVTKSFGENLVIDRFSAVLRAGNLYRLTAPSGAGKTTLLRMLCGLEKPDSGEISGVPEKIGVVFQEDRLINSLSTLENLALVIPGKADPALIRTHLAELGLADCAEMLPEELSGGMKRRTAIIRAVMYPCSLLLLDEPFTGLDDAARSLTADYLLRHLEGRTCVISSHISDPKLDACSELLDF